MMAANMVVMTMKMCAVTQQNARTVQSSALPPSLSLSHSRMHNTDDDKFKLTAIINEGKFIDKCIVWYCFVLYDMTD